MHAEAPSTRLLLGGARAAGAPRVRRGFTLAELLGVAAILLILLLIAGGAVTSLLYGSERSLAENQLRVAIGAGRDAALRSTTGDGGVVFYFRGGRTVAVPVVSVGVLPRDRVLAAQGTADGDTTQDREVFVPVTGAQPIAMPRNWTVRGFAPPGSLHGSTLIRTRGPAGTGAAPQNLTGWYAWIAAAAPNAVNRGLWLFPEDSVIDQSTGATPAENGWRRNTFMLRFSAGTGELVSGDTDTVLVVDPLPDDQFRGAAPYDAYRLDRSENLARTVRQLIAEAQGPLHANASQNNATDLHALLGAESPDTVLARPVSEIALSDERRLAAALGARRLPEDRGSLFLTGDLAYDPGTSSPLDLSLFSQAGLTDEEVLLRITRAVAGQSPDAAANNDEQTLESRIFTVSRFGGQVLEVRP